MALKVAPEMLEQRHFLLQIFWVYSKRVLPAEILRVRLVAFHIVEMDEVGIQNHLGGVIEEHACGIV